MPLPARFAKATPLLQCRTSTLFSYVDAHTGEPGVVRQLLVPEGMSPEERTAARQQFFREGTALQGLAHRGLPRIQELLEEGGGLYMVLDPFDGHTLGHVADHIHGLPQEKLLVRWMSQLAGVLAYLHGQKEPIFYRNLRPDTVMLTSNATVILVDFGIARLVEARGGRTLFRHTGDLAFAPPEQFSEAHTTPMVDVYSLGAIIYAAATRKTPPSGWDRMFSQALLPPLRSLNPYLSQGFEDLVHRMLSLDPHLRPQSMTEVLEMLQALAGPVPAPGPVEAPPPGPGTKAPPGEAPVSRSAALPSDGEVRASPRTEPAEVKEGNCGSPPKGAPLGEGTGQFVDLLVDKLPAPVEASSRRAPFSWRLPWFGRAPAPPGPAVAPATHSQPSPDDVGRWPHVDLGTIPLDRSIGQLLPDNVSRVIDGVCIGRPNDHELLVAVCDPSRIEIYDHVQLVTHRQFTAVLVRADAALIELAREFIYQVSSRFADVPWLEWMQKKKYQADSVAVVRQHSDDDPEREEARGPAQEAVDRMFKEAISLGASDIHVETYEHEIVLRYRIDGVLTTMDTWPRRQAVAYLKRIKILANMDIAQDRVPQGGRISLKVGEREFDMRVSSVPVNHGESIVMRLLSKGAFDLTLEDLGFSDSNMLLFRRLVARPHGLVLVSGPTGSGKSTTLYAALAAINRPDRKILTVEDPIEYEMPGVTQVQVNMAPREEEKRVTFARALREVLRQDSDVILVGEIRDDETASICIQAALTGHLVLSTIHTNDSFGIVTRLRDRGIEPFLLASTLSGAVAQRLVRRLCPDCKTVDSEPLDRALAGSMVDGAIRYKARGCVACRNTGYKGRISLFEVFENTPEMRRLIGRQASEDDMLALARTQGLKTLYEDGMAKVGTGLVSVAEVKRVCMT